jgi:hypothetical protein
LIDQTRLVGTSRSFARDACELIGLLQQQVVARR